MATQTIRGLPSVTTVVGTMVIPVAQNPTGPDQGMTVNQISNFTVSSNNFATYQGTGTSTVNSLVHFNNTSGLVSSDAQSVFNRGNISAGQSGVKGDLYSYPTAALSGFMHILSTSSSGNYECQLTNKPLGQSTTFSLPDPGISDALVGVIDPASVNGNLITYSSGILEDSGIPAANVVNVSGNNTFTGNNQFQGFTKFGQNISVKLTPSSYYSLPSTLSATDAFNGVVRLNPSTSSQVLTLPTFASIEALGKNLVANDSFKIVFQNIGNFPVQLSVNTGIITPSGSSTLTIAANSSQEFIFSREASDYVVFGNQQTASSSSSTFNLVTTTSATLLPSNEYMTDNVSLVTLTLSPTWSQGDKCRIVGKGAGLWKIAQNSGQQIVFLGQTPTTVGTSGSITATQMYQVMELECLTANSLFSVTYASGYPYTVV